MLGLYESTAEQDGEQAAKHEESDGEDGLPWDEQLAKLPSDLRVIWGRAQQLERRLELKTVLDEVPIFDILPRRPPVNNHRGDGAKGIDRTIRTWQQTQLHVLRMLALLYEELTWEETSNKSKTRQCSLQPACLRLGRQSGKAYVCVFDMGDREKVLQPWFATYGLTRGEGTWGRQTTITQKVTEKSRSPR